MQQLGFSETTPRGSCKLVKLTNPYTVLYKLSVTLEALTVTCDLHLISFSSESTST